MSIFFIQISLFSCSYIKVLYPSTRHPLVRSLGRSNTWSNTVIRDKPIRPCACVRSFNFFPAYPTDLGSGDTLLLTNYSIAMGEVMTARAEVRRPFLQPWCSPINPIDIQPHTRVPRLFRYAHEDEALRAKEEGEDVIHGQNRQRGLYHRYSFKSSFSTRGRGVRLSDGG